MGTGGTGGEAPQNTTMKHPGCMRSPAAASRRACSEQAMGAVSTQANESDKETAALTNERGTRNAFRPCGDHRAPSGCGGLAQPWGRRPQGVRQQLRAGASPFVLLFFLVAIGMFELVGAGRVMSAERRQRPGHEEVVQMERAGLAKPTRAPGVTLTGSNTQYRQIYVPPHRFTPIKTNWQAFARPIVQSLKLQIRMNIRTRSVELRSCQYTQDLSAIARAEAYTRAYVAGFPLVGPCVDPDVCVCACARWRMLWSLL